MPLPNSLEEFTLDDFRVALQDPRTLGFICRSVSTLPQTTIDKLVQLMGDVDFFLFFGPDLRIGMNRLSELLEERSMATR